MAKKKIETEKTITTAEYMLTDFAKKVGFKAIIDGRLFEMPIGGDMDISNLTHEQIRQMLIAGVISKRK